MMHVKLITAKTGIVAVCVWLHLIEPRINADRMQQSHATELLSGIAEIQTHSAIVDVVSFAILNCDFMFIHL
jgi:hypothetical protein